MASAPNGIAFKDLLCKFGIEDDPRWTAVVLFVRNLVRDLSVFTEQDKAAIQQDIFDHIARRDFSEQAYHEVLERLNHFVGDNIVTRESRTALEAEKRSTAALLDEMRETVEAMRKSDDRRESKLDQVRRDTEEVIEREPERERILAQVREQFETLIQELRNEASEWEARARRLEHTARFDPLLTQLHNRRALDAQIKELTEAYRQTGEPVALMMIDVDHFKRVNDSLGHQVGDEVLKELASIVSSQATLVNGFPARYGGEELVVVTQGLPASEAAIKAEAIRRIVEKTRFVPAVKGYDGGEISFTVSIGVANIQPGWMASDLLRAADRALYIAKDSGRNMVITSVAN